MLEKPRLLAILRTVVIYLQKVRRIKHQLKGICRVKPWVSWESVASGGMHSMAWKRGQRPGRRPLSAAPIPRGLCARREWTWQPSEILIILDDRGTGPRGSPRFMETSG